MLLGLGMTLLAFAAQATEPAAPADKMICRREAPIGSLIASRKTCLTQKQWEARAEQGNRTAREMVYRGTGTLNQYNSDPVTPP